VRVQLVESILNRLHNAQREIKNAEKEEDADKKHSMLNYALQQITTVQNKLRDREVH
jgi:hypothetical protein